MKELSLPVQVVVRNYGDRVLTYAGGRTSQLETKAVVQFDVGFVNVEYQRHVLNFLGPNGVLVGFLSVPICGSDVSNILQGYKRERIGGNSGFDMEGSGVINGHEALLVILSKGKDVDGFEPGEIYMVQADMRGFNGLQAVGYRVPGGFRGLGIYGPNVQKFLVKVHSPEEGERKVGLIEASMIEGPACIYASHKTGPIRGEDRTILINGGGGNMASLHLKEILYRLNQGELTSLEIIYLADIMDPGMDRAISRFGHAFGRHDVELLKVNVKETELGSAIDGKVDYYIETVKQFPELTLERCRTMLSENGMLMAYAGMARGEGPVILVDGTKYSIGDVHWDGKTLQTKQGFWISGNTGSTVEDMVMILRRLKTGDVTTLDDVGALCGPKAMEEALHAMHEKRYPGKIVALPQYTGLPLTDIKGLEGLEYGWSVEDMEAIRAGVMTRGIDETLLRHFAGELQSSK